MENNIPKYTTILHKARIELNLTCNEYCLADIIYHLSNNPNSKILGWCYASKEQLAMYLGISKQAIHSLINTLISKNIIEKDIDTKWLKTTNVWYEGVIIEKLKTIKTDSKESLLPVKKVYSKQSRKFTPDSKESLLNIYNDIYNDNNNTNTSKSKICKEANKTQDLIVLFYENLNPNIRFGNKTMRKDAEFLVNHYPFEKLEAMVMYIKDHKNEQYFPSISTPSQLREKMSAIINHYNRSKTNSPKLIKI